MVVGDLVVVIFDKPTEPLSSWYKVMYRNQDPAVVLQIDDLPHGQKLVHILYEGVERLVMFEHLRLLHQERIDEYR